VVASGDRRSPPRRSVGRGTGLRNLSRQPLASPPSTSSRTACSCLRVHGPTRPREPRCRSRPRPPRAVAVEPPEPLHRLGRRPAHRGPGRPRRAAPASGSRASASTSRTPRRSGARRRPFALARRSGLDVPVIRDAALNERDYGDLAGLDKAATAERYGAEQVHVWRRSFDVAPPGGESLKDTAARTLPFFERAILEDVRAGRDVLVVAHGNSNRSIVMRLDGLDEEAVTSLELATGVPARLRARHGRAPS
jgi:broad specificity phosphatase PhoE